MTARPRALVAALTLSLAATSAAQESPAAPPPSPARALTLDECIELALERNPDASFAVAEVGAAEAARVGALGSFGPRVRAEASALRWDRAFSVSLGDLPGQPISLPELQVRDQTTTAVSVSVIQPLTPLWGVYEGYRLRELGVEVARRQEEAARQKVAFEATEAYYRLLQARRVEVVARKSVEEVQAQVARSRTFLEKGVVGRNDLLRAELGLAAARQRLIQARGNASLAQSRLAITIGLPPEAAIDPSGIPDGLASPGPSSSPGAEALERRALERRPELHEVGLRVEQGRTGVRAAWSRMLPQVNAVAAYQRNTGSRFQPEDATFAGLLATWDVWDWGATYQGTLEARARLEQALAGQAKAREGIRLEVRAAAVAVQTAAEALEVARTAVLQAEENLRLESRRYELHANTSFDVLDAETLATQARAQEQTARYEYEIARAGLDRATGNPPGSRMKNRGDRR